MARFAPANADVAQVIAALAKYGLAAQQTTAIALRDEDVLPLVTTWAPAITPFLPRGRSASRYLQEVALAIVESKELRECLQTQPGRLSVMRAIQRGAASGLSLNPQEGKAAIVVYGKKATWMPMKNGLIDLLMETGSIDAADGFVVKKNDHFALNKTPQGDTFEFEPNLDDRGAVRGYCAFALLKTGKSFVKYMSVADVQEWRDTKVPQATLYHQYDDSYNTPPAYKKGEKKEKSFWWKDPDGAGLKTVAKRLCLELHIPAIEKAVEAEDYDDIPEPGSPADRTPKGTGADDLAATLAGQEDEGETRAAEDQETTAPAPAGEPVEQDLGLDAKPATPQSAPTAPSKTAGAAPKAPKPAPAKPAASPLGSAGKEEDAIF